MVYSPDDLERLGGEEEKVVDDVISHIEMELYQRSRFDKGSFDGELPIAYKFSRLPDYGISISNEEFLKNKVIRGKVERTYREAGWDVEMIKFECSGKGYIVCLTRKKGLTDQVSDDSEIPF